MGALRTSARHLRAFAFTVPERLRNARIGLSAAIAMWFAGAGMLLAGALGAERARRGLAKVGVNDPTIALVALLVTGAIAIAIRHLVTRGEQNDLLVDGTAIDVSEIDPVLVGIRPSALAKRCMRDGETSPPHIRREVEQEISEALSGRARMVLVTGGVLKGSTTSLLAALQMTYKRRKVIVLGDFGGDGPEPLAALIARPLRWGMAARPPIVWVGDLSPRLERGGVTIAQLDRFLNRHPGIKLVGTMNAAAFQALRHSRSRMQREARAVLRSPRLTAIPMPTRLSPAEIRDARRLYPDVPHRAIPFLPAFLGLADELLGRFDAAEQEHPLAHAMVLAAVDWVRSRVGIPVPESFLRAACRSYLDPRRRTPSARELLAARRWAEEPLAGGFGMIDPVLSVGWEPAASLVERAEKLGAPIPSAVLDLMYDAIADNPGALISFGMGSVQRGRSDIAVRAWEQAARVGDDGHRKIAHGHLATLLRDRSGAGGDPLDQLLARRSGRPLRDGLGARGPALLHSGDGAPRGAFDPSRPVETTGWVARMYRVRALRFLLRTMTLGTLDLAGVTIGTVLALACKALVRGESLEVAFAHGGTIATYAAVFAIPAFTVTGLYAEDERRANFTRIALALGVLAAVASIVGMLHGDGLLSWTVAWFAFICAIPACVLLRHLYDIVVRRVLRHFNIESRVLFVGDRRTALEVKRRMVRSSGRPTTFVGYLSSNALDRADARLGSPRDLAQVLREYGITSVVIVDGDLEPDAVMRLADTCLLANATTDRPRSPAEAAIFGGSVAPGDTLALRRIAPAALTIGAQLRKRCFDAIGSFVLLTVLGLPILGMALLVWLTSPGPAFVRSYRPGLGGATFPMYKLRTSYVETPPHRSGVGAAVVASMRRDRVTPLGALLRRFGLDELPQLVNVLRGQMSLVGPRPLPMADYRRMSSWHRRRYLVAPGITGPWQISGRSGEIDLDEAARADLFYMMNWSVRLDVLILLKSILVVLREPTDMPTPNP